jgi:hypothetical protein
MRWTEEQYSVHTGTNNKGNKTTKINKRPVQVKSTLFDEPDFYKSIDSAHYKALSYLARHPNEYSGDAEHWEQCFVLHFFKINYPDIYDMMFAVPNAGKRGRTEGPKMISQGLRSGIPDIFVDIATDPYHGLRIELKKTLGSTSDVSDNQWIWIEKYEKRGYMAGVAIGYRECICLVLSYFKIKHNYFK